MKIGPVHLAKKRNRHKKICEEQSPGGLSMSKLLKEFREFAVQGNMIDMAVGMIIGAAFKDLVNSLVSDMVMPVIGLFTGKLDFSNMFISLNGELRP